MRSITLTILFFLCISCNNDSDESIFTSQTVTPTLIYDGAFSDFTYNPTQHGEIITNQTDWDNFRNNNWSYGMQIDEANNVNFSTEMVLMAFDKPRTTSSGTLSVSFGAIVENQNNISVDIIFTGQAGMAQMPSRICNFVKIPISNKPIVFE